MLALAYGSGQENRESWTAARTGNADSGKGLACRISLSFPMGKVGMAPGGRYGKEQFETSVSRAVG